MRQSTQSLLVVLSLLFVISADMRPAQAEEPYTILSVDGEEITSSETEEVWKGLFPDGVAPDFDGFDEEVRQNVLRGVVSEHLLYKEAEKAGVSERGSVKRRLEQLKKQVTIQAYVEELAASFVTEKTLEEAYAQYVEKSKDEEEVRARHILVDSEEKAEDIIKKLESGQDFIRLAKSHSADKGSAVRGGDLDYFTRDKMVKEFADTAFDLKPGEFSKPVKSQFGWHIIKVEDRRTLKTRSFADMEEQLKAEIRKQSVESYVNQLMEKAEVQYFSKKGKQQKLDLQ